MGFNSGFKGLKVWEGMEHCIVNSGVSRHSSLDADNNEGNDDDEEEEVQNRFNNASSLEFGGAQLQRSGINEICFLTRYVTSSGGTLLVAQLVEALRYKSEDRGFDSQWCHWNFSLT